MGCLFLSSSYHYTRYDYDGFFEATPGMRRAVREAADLLRSRGGHEVLEWRPGDVLAEAFALNGAFRNADAGRTFLELLRGACTTMGTRPTE